VLLHAQAQAAVVEQQVGAGADHREDLGMRQGGALVVARRLVEVEPEFGARRQRDLAVAERADAQLRALQVEQDADRPAEALLKGADGLHAGAMVLVHAVAEVEAEDVDAGAEQGLDALRRRAGGAKRGNDLG